jgi:hypothetical protein
LFQFKLSVCSHIRIPNLYIRMPGKNHGSTSFPRTSSLASAGHVSPGTCKNILLLATTRIGVVDHRIEAGLLTRLSASEYGCETLSRVLQNVFTLTIVFLLIGRTGDFLASKVSESTLESCSVRIGAPPLGVLRLGRAVQTK